MDIHYARYHALHSVKKRKRLEWNCKIILWKLFFMVKRETPELYKWPNTTQNTLTSYTRSTLPTQNLLLQTANHTLQTGRLPLFSLLPGSQRRSSHSAMKSPRVKFVLLMF
jgi:hypothetical protein